MAPTIYTEKENHFHNNIRENRKRNHHSSNSCSVISYADGKIAQRRSIIGRNAVSTLHTRISTVSDSQSENDNISQNERIDIFDQFKVYKMKENSLSSYDLDCNKRFITNEKHNNTYSTPINNNCYVQDVVILHCEAKSYQEDISMTVCSPIRTDESDSLDINYKKTLKGNNTGLLDVAVKTVKLIKRNQILQRKLAQLQFETRAFIESVLSNPENHALRDKKINI